MPEEAVFIGMFSILNVEDILTAGREDCQGRVRELCPQSLVLSEAEGMEVAWRLLPRWIQNLGVASLFLGIE
jgi:hypothetical protein